MEQHVNVTQIEEGYEVIKFSQRILENAKDLSDKEAFVLENRRVTWKEYNERCTRLSNVISAMGVKRGEGVSYLAGEYTGVTEQEIIGSCFKGGFPYIVCSPVPGLVDAERYVLHVLNTCEPRVLFYKEDQKELVDKIRPQVKYPQEFINVDGPQYEELVAKSPPTEPGYVTQAEDMCNNFISTGTGTGLPKIGKVYPVDPSNTVYAFMEMGMNRETRALVCIPPYWSYFDLLYVAGIIATGATFCCPGYYTPESILEKIEREKITWLGISPMHLSRCLEHPDVKKYDLSSVEIIPIVGVVEPELMARAARAFGKKVVVPVFACNECSLMAFVSLDEYELEGPKARRMEARAGRPPASHRTWVFDPETKKPLPPGEIGVIAMHAPGTEYWEPEETEKAYHNNWFFSDQVAVADEHGILYAKGRIEEMIRIKGKYVSPEDISKCVMKHPAVKDAAAIVVPYKELEEVVALSVSLKPGEKATEEEIIEVCERGLPEEAVPSIVEFLDEIPRQYKGVLVVRKLKEEIMKRQEM